jgi:hypothetical protein
VWQVFLVVLGAILGWIGSALSARRSERRSAATEFVNAFLGCAQAGADLLSLGMVHGDKLRTAELAEKVAPYWSAWGEANGAMERASARIRMVGNRTVRGEAVKLETYLAANVRSVPPFQVVVDTSEWGNEAKVGPAHVKEVAIIRANEFAEAARRPWSAPWKRLM